MKVDLKEPDFTPVQIIIETQEELDVLMTSLCNTIFSCDYYEDISVGMVFTFDDAALHYECDIPLQH